MARAAEEKPGRWRVAVIGHTGRGNFGHQLDTMWLGLPETTIVGVADADEVGRAAAVKRLNGTPGFADYRQMLRDLKPDVVAIAPRHIDQHAEMAVAAAEAGARGVYMEKPYCRTPEEADVIQAACDKTGMKLALAHRNRYHPALQTVRRLVAEGAIGELKEMRGAGKEDQRAGALDLWVLGSHVLNYIDFLGGSPVRQCTARIEQNGQPAGRAHVINGAEGVGPLFGNKVFARYDLAGSNAPAFFESEPSTTRKPGARFGLRLIGSKGTIFVGVDQEPLAWFESGDGQPPKAISSAGIDTPEPIPNLGKEVGSHRLAARDLLAAIEENRQPLCSARDGAMTVEMICAVFASHLASGQPVALPLENRKHPLRVE